MKINKMKAILLFLSLCLTSVLFAQHYEIPVQELNINDSAFKLHPQTIQVDIETLQNNFDTLVCKVRTEYAEDISHNPLYLSKRTWTESYVKLPYIISKQAFNRDGTINEAVMNAILVAFKLKVRPETTQ